jgi:hypothetical protein
MGREARLHAKTCKKLSNFIAVKSIQPQFFGNEIDNTVILSMHAEAKFESSFLPL